MSAKHWFSPSYQEARKRFLDSIEELREKGFEISHSIFYDHISLNSFHNDKLVRSMNL